MRQWTRALLVGALGLIAGGALGCAEERAPINRVQPNALAKSFFVGDIADNADNPEFWAQGTLIDVGYGAAQDGLFTSTYAQPVSRIKWQITEEFLIGRLAYERIEDSDGKKGLGKSNGIDEGQIAYIYPISGHFDIRRDYNPTTGEESNTIVENTTDRPWFEREYFRVDWSRNLNTDAYDYDTLSLIGIYGGVSYEPVSYYVNDPEHQDAPVFDVENGYFDVTNKALATPGVVDLSHLGWGIDSFPSCYLENDFFGGSAPAGNCNPVELTIRQGFRRVVDSDFEPEDWDGYKFAAFGAFNVERTGYSREYGMVDDKWHRFISRYNIWERSHYYANPDEMTGEIACNTEETTGFGVDPTRDEDNNGTADECEAVTKASGYSGSKCDTFKHKCTLPYRARTTKPVVWNYTKNSQQEWYEGTEWATHEWDVALRVAVQAAKYAECTRTRGGVSDGNADGLDDECAKAYPLYGGQQDDNQDAIALAREVDDCRNGLAYDGQDCEALADKLAADRGYTAGVASIAKMGEMLVLCHGPVEAHDSPLCGEARLPENISAADCDREWNSEDPDQEIVAQCNAAHSVRIGDLRYHQINVVKQPQTPSPWGIYTDAEDPLWGEKISASINVWAFVNDLWSQGVVDIMRYIQGDLAIEEITDGEYIQNWIGAEEATAKNGVAGLWTQDQIDERLASASLQALRGARGLDKDASVTVEDVKAQIKELRAHPEERAAIMAEVKPTLKRLADVRASATAASVNRPVYDQRRRQVQNTQTEAAIMTPAMQQLAGVDDAAGLPAEAKTEFSSIFRGLNPTIRRDIRQAKEAALAARGACMLQEAPAPNSMVGLSNAIIQKFGAASSFGSVDEKMAHWDRVKHYLAQRAQYAVIIHEMGHSVGERHNFVSSSQAWGYRPQYWQLRTRDGQVTEACTDLDTGSADAPPGQNCVGPRYFDPPTQEESDNLIHMFMASSVMDYAGESTQDMIGLGAYDFAAARMFYGNTISVHADPSYNVGSTRSKGMLNYTDSFGGIVGYQHMSAGYAQANGQSGAKAAGNFMHYSGLQREYDLIKNCQVVGNTWEEVEAKFKPANWNGQYGAWHPVLDGLIVNVNGQYTRCRQQPVDYVPYDSLRAATTAETDTPSAQDGFSFYSTGAAAIDQLGRTRVPYAFASDNWADLGNLAVYRHDNGADAYELFNFFITEQETRHIFDNYRRRRQSFSVRSASGRLLWRYNEKMRDGAKGLGLYYNLFREFYGADNSQTVASLATIFPDNLIAAGIAFDHFARQIGRPQSGIHSRSGGVLTSTDLGSNTSSARDLVVPDGATGFFGNVSPGGKLMENRLSDDNGDYDSNYTVNAGQYYDKIYAPYLLTESVDNFISDSLDDFVDARYRSVSMADIFPDGFRRLLGTMLTEDEAMKGWSVAANADGSPQVTGLDKFPVGPLGFTQWWTASPEVCFPNQVGTVCRAPHGEDFGTPDVPGRVGINANVNWEIWKFLVVQTMLYLPENSRNPWVNQLGIWEIGADSDPEFTNRIELHSPDGAIYVAKTSGTEEMFGKTVQKGIAARVIQAANERLALAYQTHPEGPGAVDTDGDGVTDSILDEDGDGVADATVWNVPDLDENGEWIEKSFGNVTKYQDYEPLLTFIRQTLMDFRMADPSMKGIYN